MGASKDVVKVGLNFGLEAGAKVLVHAEGHPAKIVAAAAAAAIVVVAAGMGYALYRGALLLGGEASGALAQRR